MVINIVMSPSLVNNPSAANLDSFGGRGCFSMVEIT